MIDDAFGGRLLAGERIAWRGQAGRGLVLTRRDLFLVPFSLIWCGIAIFWTFAATWMGGPGFFTIWGAMFIAVGLYFVAGRFALDAWIRNGTYYAVTDRRILIARGGPFRKFTAIHLAQLAEIDLIERANGRGTIRFGHEESIWGWGSYGRAGWGVWSPSLDPTPQFLAIDDVRRVYDLIQRGIEKVVTPNPG
jgi:hypothetical protein